MECSRAWQVRDIIDCEASIAMIKIDNSANTVGSIMADARVTVKGVQAIDASFDETTLKGIVEQARMNVNK